MSGTQTTYNDKVVRQFAVMTVIWGIVGMLVGVIIAAQLVWPELNFGPWLHFGRLRPLHTNAVILSHCCVYAGHPLLGNSTSGLPPSSESFLSSKRRVLPISRGFTSYWHKCMPVNNSCLSEYDEVDYAIRVQKPCYPLEPIPGTVAADPLVRQYPEGQLVPANLWFRNASDGEMLREMKHTSDTFERVLSLPIVPKFYPRWALDGEKGEDDNYDRFIGGGR